MLLEMVSAPRCGFKFSPPACLRLSWFPFSRGALKSATSCSNAPVSVENVPFSNTTAVKARSHGTGPAQHCERSQLLPASLRIAVRPGFLPSGCLGQLKRRRKGPGWELQAWI